MTVDNFQTIREHLTFESDFDRYIVHVLKRVKDETGRKYGVNETNRLLKTFYITSLEYFDNKIPVIKDLCESNNARAYILPQVRDNSDCLKELLKKTVENLDNPTIKPDHLIRSAYSGNHRSRDKKWILDLDNDNMTEYETILGFPHDNRRVIREWTAEEVLVFVREILAEAGKDPGEAYLVPTRNGHCVVTSPFNLQKAFGRCRMMFQGEHRFAESDVTGWLLKDGMVLLYYADMVNSMPH